MPGECRLCLPSRYLGTRRHNSDRWPRLDGKIRFVATVGQPTGPHPVNDIPVVVKCPGRHISQLRSGQPEKEAEISAKALAIFQETMIVQEEYLIV